MRAICSFSGFALAATLALAGCGGEARDATSKELSALTAEISRLRAEQSAMAERLDAIERGRPRGAAEPVAEAPKTAAPAAPTAAAAVPLDSDRPSLDVVRLGPSADDGDDVDGDTDAEGPRTVLRSGANGIVVEEAGTAAAARTGAADAKKAAPAVKKSDKADKKKTAAQPTP